MVNVTDILGNLTGQTFSILLGCTCRSSQRCPKNLLAPLLNFLIALAEQEWSQFKLYDNRNYRTFRDASSWGRKDPPLEDVVGGIYRFMTSRGIINR